MSALRAPVTRPLRASHVPLRQPPTAASSWPSSARRRPARARANKSGACVLLLRRPWLSTAPDAAWRATALARPRVCPLAHAASALRATYLPPSFRAAARHHRHAWQRRAEPDGERLVEERHHRQDRPRQVPGAGRRQSGAAPQRQHSARPQPEPRCQDKGRSEAQGRRARQ